MIIFLSGGAKSGKSSLAQNLAVTLAGEKPHYYVATMLPTDGEDRERIRLHVEDRDGMGFLTVECGTHILSCLPELDPEGTVLLDSATALLMNEMFPVERNYEMDLEAAYRCGQELVQFAWSVSNAVIVSDYIYSDAGRYDETTEAYRRCLAEIDRALAAAADTVVEVTTGSKIIQKGGLPL